MTNSVKLHKRWRHQRTQRCPGWPAWGLGVYWLVHFLRWCAVEGA